MSKNYWEQPGYPKHDCQDHYSDPDHCLTHCEERTNWFEAELLSLQAQVKELKAQSATWKDKATELYERCNDKANRCPNCPDFEAAILAKDEALNNILEGISDRNEDWVVAEIQKALTLTPASVKAAQDQAQASLAVLVGALESIKSGTIGRHPAGASFKEICIRAGTIADAALASLPKPGPEDE